MQQTNLTKSGHYLKNIKAITSIIFLKKGSKGKFCSFPELVETKLINATTGVHSEEEKVSLCSGVRTPSHSP